MDCSAYEQRLADLKKQRRELKDAMEIVPPHKLPEMQEQLDALTAQIKAANEDLEECRAIAAGADGQPPRPFTLRVKELRCEDAGREIGVDEPYLIAATVDRLGQVTLGTVPFVGPVGFNKASVHTLHVGPWTKVKAGETYSTNGLDANPSLWDLSGEARALASPEDAIFLVSVLENDGASPDSISGAVNSALEVSLVNNAQLEYEALATTLASAMTGAIDVSLGAGIAPGHLNFDDRIDRATHLALTQNDLDTLAAGRSVEKALWFVREKKSGKWTDRYRITFTLAPQ